MLTFLIVTERGTKRLRSSFQRKIPDPQGVVMADQGQVPVAGPVWALRRVEW